MTIGSGRGSSGGCWRRIRSWPRSTGSSPGTTSSGPRYTAFAHETTARAGRARAWLSWPYTNRRFAQHHGFAGTTVPVTAGPRTPRRRFVGGTPIVVPSRMPPVEPWARAPPGSQPSSRSDGERRRAVHGTSVLRETAKGTFFAGTFWQVFVADNGKSITITSTHPTRRRRLRSTGTRAPSPFARPSMGCR